jgi:hypothetical protein
VSKPNALMAKRKEEGMKRLIIFAATILLLIGTVGFSSATPITIDLTQAPLDRSGRTPYGEGSLTYQSSATSFMGSLTVDNLIEGMTYQMKLEGQTADDPWGSEQLGLIGRWWYKDSSYYWGGYDPGEASAQSSIAAGDANALGYILFDSFVYNGPMSIDFYLESSYHTAGVPQSGRPAPGDVVMAYGDYTAMFLLTEDGEPWESPLLAANVEFSVAPVPEPGTIVLMGLGLVGLAGMGRKKLFKK